jgi:hypothetical protein
MGNLRSDPDAVLNHTGVDWQPIPAALTEAFKAAAQVAETTVACSSGASPSPVCTDLPVCTHLLAGAGE